MRDTRRVIGLGAGVGTAELVAALTALLPAARDTGPGEPHGTVF